MVLTRSFKETVKARVHRDRVFKEALLAEGRNTPLEGDLDTGKADAAAERIYKTDQE